MSKAENVAAQFERNLEQLGIDPKSNKDYQQLFDVIQKGVVIAQRSISKIDAASSAIKQIKD